MTSPTESTRLVDPRGNRLGTASHEAADRVEAALWRMMSFYDAPTADLAAAREADPAWAMPAILLAGHLLAQGEPGHAQAARALLDEAEPLLHGAPEREVAHHAALAALADGRWQQAARAWGELLLEHPRDALALHWAHACDLALGETAALRLRPARVLPEWDDTDPLYPCVLGLYAFGLAETHLYPQAEEAGRRALAGDARVPWAVLAVAQVMDRLGRFEDGAAWLRQHQPGWADGNDFATHLWWQMALFRLEALDMPGVHRLADAHLSGPALRTARERLDAVSLLWRMHLLQEDVGARFTELLRDWPLDAAHAGHHALVDLHVLMALLGASELVRAETWVARCAERAMSPEDARRSNHAVAREVGLPLMRGLLALARGDADAAVTALHGARPQAWRLGGSHAQRELIDHTLLAASATAHHRSVGRALLNERRMAKPMTPLTRHWVERMGT